jgi:kinesin family protein C2/C3
MLMDNENGTYHIAATATVSGSYRFDVRMNDQPVRGGRGLAVEMLPGPTDPAHCMVSGAVLDRGTVVDSAATFTIQARDRFGNKRAAGDDDFVFALTGPAGVEDTFVSDNRDGSYTGIFTARAGGKYHLVVLLKDLSVGAHGSAGSEITVYPNLKSFAFRVIEDRARKELVRYRELMRQVKAQLASLHAEVEEMQADMPLIVRSVCDQVMSVIRVQAATLEAMNSKYGFECDERKRLFNVIQELRGNIRVFCRVRPFNAMEMQRGLQSVLSFPRPNVLTLLADDSSRVNMKDKQFRYDCVFEPSASQEEIFEETKPVVTSVLDGYNVCIFAYGQTGSGKTYTMEGEPPHLPGVNYRALAELFRVIRGPRARDYRYKISVSVLEIYNDTIRDLLDDSHSARKLDVMHHALGHWVPGLTIVNVTNPEEVFEIMRRGLQNRAVGVTNMNEHSSRSHCVMTVYAEGVNTATGLKYFGKLHMVDLAGSERVQKSGSTGDRLTEAQVRRHVLFCVALTVSAAHQQIVVGTG